MDTIEVIYSRKSCRKFKAIPVDAFVQRELIMAAQQAPSPKNIQPWRFKIVTDERQKQRIANALLQNIKKLKKESEIQKVNRTDLDVALESVEIIKQAPMLVFVYLVIDSLNLHEDGVKWKLNAKDGESTFIMSIGAAIQNMILAATDKGLGSLWMADIFYAYNEIKEIIGIDANMMSAIAIGYSDDYSKKSLRKPLNEILM